MATSNAHHIFKANGGSIADDHKLLAIARKGISKGAMLKVARALELKPKELAAILQISERTLQRFGTAGMLNAALSGRVIQLARVYEQGLEVFGNRGTLRDWLRAQNPVLGESPLELLDTPVGTQMVLDELIRIAHGVYV
jgi:putative toxin-antitoxin system antitoxin component (TIGR02293 family)